MKIIKSDFGMTARGELVNLYHIENASGAYIEVLDYGARVHKIVVPNKDGELVNACLSFSTVAEYEKDDSYRGSICGRVANRICKGRFSLNGVDYQLAINNGENHLHGGNVGYAYKVWEASVKDDKLVLVMNSPDGEENYPGNLTLTVTYGWSEDNELSILYEATCDQDTIINVTNHAYFNLNNADGTILNHELFIDADTITPVDETLIPTGEFLPVDGTPFDFRNIHAIGKLIENEDPHFSIVGTYDHNFAINGTGLREAAVLQSKESGIRMTCFTDQPGLQIYVAPVNTSVCLETQHYPDSINHENFPSVVLKAAEQFRSKTLYHFSNF